MTRPLALSGVRGPRASAALVVAGALLSGPGAMLVVALAAPQPPWSGVETFADHYHPLQALPYLLGYLLLAGFVLFAAACHALADEALRLRASAALVLTAVYAALVFTNYTLQLGLVPHALADRPPWLAVLTMANPASLAWLLEMFGYGALGAATWLVAPAFGGTRRGATIRFLLVANGVTSLAGAACTALYDRWVFSTAGLVSFAAWNVLVPACFLLVALAPDGGLADRPRRPA